MLGGATFAVVVLATELPVGAVLAQHRQLGSSSAQLRVLQADDRALAGQVKSLSSPGTVAEVARQQYELVGPGDQVYEIIPAPGADTSSIVGLGHVPLDGPPVVPGSAASRALLGVGQALVSPGAPAPASSGTSRRGGRAAHRASTGAWSDTGGFWSRVERTLEFWR